MTTDDENHIIRTTTKRLAKGLVIVIGIMIVGAVIAISQWDYMASVPPQSAKLKPKFDLSTSTAAGHGAPVASSAAVSTAEAPAAAAKPKEMLVRYRISTHCRIKESTYTKPICIHHD